MSHAQFEKTVELINAKDNPIKPSQNDQLKFYGLYKQATVGDVNTSKPGMFDMVGKAKWSAWEANKGKSKEDAEKEYYQAFQDLCEKNGSDEAKALAKQAQDA